MGRGFLFVRSLRRLSKSIEDCEVCCRPIEFSYTVGMDGLSSFEVFRLD